MGFPLDFVPCLKGMIKVSGLTKRYVGNTAVDNISFEVGKGEIVGFLGPNGAGKSTTIRMLTCYMTPTSGFASIDGLDIEKESVEVRKRIGYMPENVPLYLDMRVHEYLNFRGALKGLKGQALKDGVAESIETCGLKEVNKKIIATLSKGYRQRVGLADALVHKPELLILDEPTNGLDPQQIRLFRKLIKDLGKKHTIFLSTHILPEVEMTCDRVIIINQGKIRASDTPQNLVNRRLEGSDIMVEVKAKPAQVIPQLKAITGVSDVTEESFQKGYSRLRVSMKKVKLDMTEKIHEVVIKNDWKLRELSLQHGTLEDAFVAIVKKEQNQNESKKS